MFSAKGLNQVDIQDDNSYGNVYVGPNPFEQRLANTREAKIKSERLAAVRSLRSHLGVLGLART